MRFLGALEFLIVLCVSGVEIVEFRCSCLQSATKDTARSRSRQPASCRGPTVTSMGVCDPAGAWRPLVPQNG